MVLISVVLFSALSCTENDDTLTTLETVRFNSKPQVTPEVVQLTQEAQAQPAINISWEEVHFPVPEAPVAYNLQFGIASDTIGENAWENAITKTVGEDVLSTEVSVEELNAIALDLGLVPAETATMAVRVRAFVDREVFSNTTAFEVTPYEVIVGNNVLYLPGAYQGWDPVSAGTLSETATPGVFVGYLTFEDPTALEFKFTTAPNWDDNYGGDGNGNLVFEGNNVSVPNVGSYQITVNMNTMTWMAESYSWGIIGTATPGGWDADTDMSYNYQQDYWEFTGALVAGALKFRLNDQWNVNYGSPNSTDFIAYLDDPGAHDVAAAGNYHVTFQIDPTDPNIAYYTVELQ